MQKPRAVFLDRDGVLNDARVDAGKPYPPKRPDEVIMLPGVADACRRLADAGWVLVVVTNQPDIARGLTTRQNVDAINDAVSTGLPITAILVCPHDDVDGCRCRKPLPGMLLEAAERWHLDLSASVIVGDRWRDIEAGRQAGVTTIFVDRGYAEELRSEPDYRVAGLGDVAELLLDRPRASVDDWESHWDHYSDSTSDNPAQAFRRQLITALVERDGTPARVLDIGSGQGDLLASLSERWPGVELAGIELSAEGVRRASQKVPGARFVQLDLLQATDIPPGLEAWAQVAVCSEVVEHVDDAARFLRAAAAFINPGGTLVVTVPGGPRTAFDRYIGHRRHYRRASLEKVLQEAGFEIALATGAGFPFFNLYKLVVLLRGRAVARDVSSRAAPSRLAALVMRVFGVLLRPGLNSSRFGWQLVAVARRPP